MRKYLNVQDIKQYTVRYRGEWRDDVAYSPRDYVIHQDTVYYCKTRTTEEPTESSVYWGVSFYITHSVININQEFTVTNNSNFNLPKHTVVGFVNESLNQVSDVTYELPMGITTEEIDGAGTGRILRRGDLRVNLPSTTGALLDEVYLTNNNALSLNNTNLYARVGRIKNISERNSGYYIVRFNFRSYDGIATISETDASSNVNFGKHVTYSDTNLSLTTTGIEIHDTKIFADYTGTYLFEIYPESTYSGTDSLSIRATYEIEGQTENDLLAYTIFQHDRYQKPSISASVSLTANTEYVLKVYVRSSVNKTTGINFKYTILGTV